MGGNGDDVLIGNPGNDWLSGDRGHETVTGGAGADTFVIAKNSGRDTFTDFSLNDGDKIALSGGLRYSNLNFSGNQILFGSNVLVNFANGVNAASLSTNNFVSV